MNQRFIRLMLLLTCAAALLGQGEQEPYFALSSFRTYAPGGSPSVSLSAWKVATLEFRVYRVSDPIRFFQQLEDAHQFGGRAQRPPRERSVLENMRLWKRSFRASIRRSLRAQFSESPSEHINKFLPHAEPVNAKNLNTTKEIQFADVPVLNPQQLVLSFVKRVVSNSVWAREDIEVPVHEKGIYLVEAVNKDLRAYTLVMLSDLVLVTKNSSSGRIVNFAMDRGTGQPLGKVNVTAISNHQINARVQTDNEGIAEVHAPVSNDSDVILVARNEHDIAVNAVRSWGTNSDQWTGYIYTDRPIYRPGHTVHFKGVFRLHTPDGYQVPVGRSILLSVEDGDQKPVYQKTLTTTANGTIHDELTLSPGVSLGYYSIQAKSGDQAIMSGDFEVQDYKKPEYEVRVTPEKTRVLQGETVQTIIDARYFFGEPVSHAKVKYSILRSRYWFPLWYDPEDDSLPQQSDVDTGDSGDTITEQEAEINADGKLTIEVPTAVSNSKTDLRYRVEVGVTDAANREVTGTAWIIATYGNFVLNVTPDRYVYSPGGQGSFTIEARNYENHPISTQAHVEVKQWSFDGKSNNTISATDVNIGPDGSASVNLPIPHQGGSYLVRATAPSVQGRTVEAAGYVWVSGGTWNFDTGRGHEVQMITDKKSYRSGDTAKVMIVAGQSNTAVYVTIEGRELRQTKLIRSLDSTLSYAIPVTARDEPGITVNAAFVRDGVLYNGSKYVRVPPVQHELNVKVATDKAQYSPGQTAEYSLDVTGADGKPAAGAEFSLGIVDEAIYGLRPDNTQNILSFFFGRDYNRVNTVSSLEYFFTSEAGKKRMQLAQMMEVDTARARLAQLKPEHLVQPKVRKAFPDTTFWAADLVTDKSGHTHAKVEFPDSLTTWRTTARGITPDTKVGAATLKTIVRKNLIVRLTTPRFLVRGDEVVISALVHNYLQEAKTARVSLQVSGLDLVEGGTKDVQVPSRGEAKVDWRLRAQETRKVSLVAKALTNEESDAIEMELPVNFPGVKMSQSKGGSIVSGESSAFDLSFAGNVEPGSRSIQVRISPTLVGSLFGALEYLTSFPYGCVEQTMSSFLPNIVVKDAVRNLNIKTNIDEVALQEKIRAGLERLYSFQHEDGGWGWWQTDESHPFMTAYVVAGLVQARNAGTQVDQQALDKGAEWLKKYFAQDRNLAADLRAYLAYAMAAAGQSDSATLADIYDRRSRLSSYGMALLGLTLEQRKDGKAAEIAAALERAAQQDGTQAWWPAARDEMLDFAADITPETTAYVAKFLSHQHKDSPLLPKAAVWLMNHRNEGYWWSSTKQTAMVIYGLADYLKVSQELSPNLNANVYVNDKPVLAKHIQQLTTPDTPDLVLNESQLQPGINHIRVSATGTGRLYYSVRCEYHSSDARFQKNGTIGLDVLRDYFRLAPAKEGDHIVYDTLALDGPVSVGDIVVVRVTVTGSAWKYVMVEDPIPAGTEFIERDNLYELRDRPSWWQYYFTRREFHDDRMAIFETEFPQGQLQYFYLLKVVNPGVFKVPPARVGPMYQTDIMATTEPRQLEVK